MHTWNVIKYPYFIFQIGLDKKVSPDTLLTFVTTGVLLQALGKL